MATEEQSQQIFFDRDGKDSFLGEVISIMKIVKIHIDIKHVENMDIDWPKDKSVRIQFEGAREHNMISDWLFSCTVFGRSYGECLFLLRKRIREETYGS